MAAKPVRLHQTIRNLNILAPTSCSRQPTLPSSSSRSSPARPASKYGYCRPSNAYFSSQARSLKQQDNNQNGIETATSPAQAAAAAKKSSKRKAARTQATTSLRRVAVEAQRSHDDFIKGTGKRRFVDPDADTKEVTAYCVAEQYNIPIARRQLVRERYEIDPLNTGSYPQVIHVQTPNYLARDEDGSEKAQGPGDIFVFPSGTVAMWNVPERVQHDMVNRISSPAAENPHLDALEVEDLDYLEDPSRDSSQIIGETIILGTKPSDSTPTDSESSASTDNLRTNDMDAILAKIAFSSGSARSTKLAVLENLSDSYFVSTRHIPTLSSRGQRLNFTRSFISRKTGESLSIRAQSNLYSELTDSSPDSFWDSPSSLGLSAYYDEVGRALDVGVRIKVSNERMDYASEIASVLRERSSEKHSTGLEWLIIFLISVEVGFELWRIGRERREAAEVDSTEASLRRWLLAQEEKRSRER